MLFFDSQSTCLVSDNARGELLYALPPKDQSATTTKTSRSQTTVQRHEVILILACYVQLSVTPPYYFSMAKVPQIDAHDLEPVMRRFSPTAQRALVYKIKYSLLRPRGGHAHTQCF